MSETLALIEQDLEMDAILRDPEMIEGLQKTYLETLPLFAKAPQFAEACAHFIPSVDQHHLEHAMMWMPFYLDHSEETDADKEWKNGECFVARLNGFQQALCKGAPNNEITVLFALTKLLETNRTIYRELVEANTPESLDAVWLTVLNFVKLANGE